MPSHVDVERGLVYRVDPGRPSGPDRRRPGGAMIDFEHEVKPGVGIGALLLGMTRDEVRERIGDPTEIERTDVAGVTDENWSYDALQLRLSFGEDDEWRLWSINSSCPWATLEGVRVVGICESDLLALDFGGESAPELADDFDEFGRDYEWGETGVSFWVRAEDSLVDSVTVLPLYDASGEVPLWPDPGQSRMQ
ncbi:MAG: hypothetical protein AAGB93_01410 [Planctomycetota bacterium]